MNVPDVPLGSHVGILGGSFDPPHLSHQFLALAALALEPIDSLWVIPCADHPFAKNLSPFKHRLRMCELAFSHLKGVLVLDIEKSLQAPNYTVRTLLHILHARPDLKLSLVMGGDVFEQLSTWHEPERLLELCDVVVFPREGFSTQNHFLKSDRIHIHEGIVLPGIKSREIRSGVRDENWIDQKVAQYAASQELYC